MVTLYHYFDGVQFSPVKSDSSKKIARSEKTFWKEQRRAKRAHLYHSICIQGSVYISHLDTSLCFQGSSTTDKAWGTTLGRTPPAVRLLLKEPNNGRGNTPTM